MKTLNLPIILVSGLAVVGMTELLWLFANNSQATLALRFSHTFFNIFTLVPFSIMAIGIAAITLVFRRRYIPKIRSQIILFGVIVILAGLGTFSLYLLD